MSVVVSGWVVEAILLFELRKLKGMNEGLLVLPGNSLAFILLELLCGEHQSSWISDCATFWTSLLSHFCASRYTNDCTGPSCCTSEELCTSN